MSEIEDTETIETETTETNEQETFNPPVEATYMSFIEIEVCCHNIVSAVIPLLESEISLDFPTNVELDAPLSSPSLSASIIWVNPQISAPLPSPSVANPNLYNQSPTLNSSVAKTP